MAERYHGYLHDTQERLTLIASGPQQWVESQLHDWLETNEPDSEARVVISQVVESLDAGDFVMRGRRK